MKFAQYLSVLIFIAMPAIAQDIATRVERNVVIEVPKNYDPKVPTPVILYYHGMGMKPNVDLLKAYTQGQDYILVGMNYAVAEGVTPTSQEQATAHLELELRMYRAVRKWLPKKMNIDENRIYLAGTSRGGWTVSKLADREMENLAGLIIFMAGRGWLQDRPINTKAFKNKKIYIGIGENDPNNLHAHWAKVYYKQLGANVCFDELEGLGHSMSTDSKLFTCWLRANGRLVSLDDAKAKELNTWITAELDEVRNETDTMKRYHALHSLRRNPMTRLCSKNALSAANSLWTALSRDPAIGPEWKAETIFDQALRLEQSWVISKSSNPSGLTTAYKNFKRVAEVFPNTRYGKLAAASRDRLQKTLKSVVTTTSPSKKAIKPPTMPGNIIGR
jgi:predicted esterase